MGQECSTAIIESDDAPQLAPGMFHQLKELGEGRDRIADLIQHVHRDQSLAYAIEGARILIVRQQDVEMESPHQWFCPEFVDVNALAGIVEAHLIRAGASLKPNGNVTYRADAARIVDAPMLSFRP